MVMFHRPGTRAKGWKGRPLQRCGRITKQRLQFEEVIMAKTTTAEELERLHGWLGNLIEELEEARALVAVLYADEEGRL